MYRGNLSFVGAPTVAYDFCCLISMTPFQEKLLKHLPSVGKFYLKMEDSALKEIEAMIRIGYVVEIVFWGYNKETIDLAKKVYKVAMKRFKPQAKMVWKNSSHEIRAGNPRYENFFTNRPEVTPYFPPDFIKMTMFQTNLKLKKLNLEKLGLKWK